MGFLGFVKTGDTESFRLYKHWGFGGVGPPANLTEAVFLQSVSDIP